MYMKRTGRLLTSMKTISFYVSEILLMVFRYAAHTLLRSISEMKFNKKKTREFVLFDQLFVQKSSANTLNSQIDWKHIWFFLAFFLACSLAFFMQIVCWTISH